MAEIQKKYKNMKCIAKKEVALNALECKKTGGGKAVVTNSVAFDFSDKQIVGLDNTFDSDYVAPVSSAVSVVSDAEKSDDEDLTMRTMNEPTTSSAALKYSNKKMKLSAKKHDLVALKEEGIKLDIEGKKLFIESTKLEIEKGKLDIELKKLDIEIKKKQLGVD